MSPHERLNSLISFEWCKLFMNFIAEGKNHEKQFFAMHIECPQKILVFTPHNNVALILIKSIFFSLQSESRPSADLIIFIYEIKEEKEPKRKS